jgi:hypothetical protein
MFFIKKLIVMLFSAWAGLIAGTVAGIPLIAVINYLAQDGPYFPAPLVAFALLALPIGALLFFFQLLFTVCETFTSRVVEKTLFLPGILGGAAAGALWYSVLASSEFKFSMLLAVVAISSLQAFVVFGCHWIGSKLNIVPICQA